MSGELERPALEGKIVKDGVVADVAREGGRTRVHLSFVPGREPVPDGRGVTVVPFPEGLVFGDGETVTVTWEGRSATFPDA